jgi:hypothetical protein
MDGIDIRAKYTVTYFSIISLELFSDLIAQMSRFQNILSLYVSKIYRVDDNLWNMR